jgi:hypothetical protein
MKIKLGFILLALFAGFGLEGCREKNPTATSSSETKEGVTASDKTMVFEKAFYTRTNSVFTERYAFFRVSDQGKVSLHVYNVASKTSNIYCFDPGCEHIPPQYDLVTGELLSPPCMAYTLGATTFSLRNDCSYYFLYPNLFRADIEGKNRQIVANLNLPFYFPTEELYTEDYYFLRYDIYNEMIEQEDKNGDSYWVSGDALDKRKVGIIRVALSDGKIEEVFSADDLYDLYISPMVEYNGHLHFLCSGLDVPFDTLPNGFEDWAAYNEAATKHSRTRVYDYNIASGELSLIISEDHNDAYDFAQDYIVKSSKLNGELYDASGNFIRKLPFSVGRVIQSDEYIIVQESMDVNDTKRRFHMYDADEDKIVRSVEIENLTLQYAIGDSYYGIIDGKTFYISAADFWAGNTDRYVILEDS